MASNVKLLLSFKSSALTPCWVTEQISLIIPNFASTAQLHHVSSPFIAIKLFEKSHVMATPGNSPEVLYVSRSESAELVTVSVILKKIVEVRSTGTEDQ